MAQNDVAFPIVIPAGNTPEGKSWNALGKNRWEELRSSVPSNLAASHHTAQILRHKESELGRLIVLFTSRLAETSLAIAELHEGVPKGERGVSIILATRSGKLPPHWHSSDEKIFRQPLDQAADEVLVCNPHQAVAEVIENLSTKATSLERDLSRSIQERASIFFHRQLLTKAIQQFESLGSIPPWRSVPTSRKLRKLSDSAHNTTMKVGQLLIENGPLSKDRHLDLDSSYSQIGFKGIEAFKKFMAESLGCSEVTIYNHLTESGVWVEGKRGKRSPSRVDEICDQCIKYVKRHS